MRRNYQCDLFASDIWSLWCASCLHTAGPVCAPPGLSADVVNTLLSPEQSGLHNIYNWMQLNCWVQPLALQVAPQHGTKYERFISSDYSYCFLQCKFCKQNPFCHLGKLLTQYSYLSGWYDEYVHRQVQYPGDTDQQINVCLEFCLFAFSSASGSISLFGCSVTLSRYLFI